MKNLSYLFLIFIVFSCTKKEDKDAPANFEIKADEQASLEFLVDLIKDNPKNAANYIRLSDYYLHNQDYTTAITILENAHDILPDHLEINQMLLRAYFRKDELEKAEKLFNVVQNKDHADPYILGMIHFHKGEFEEALKLANLSIQRDNGNAAYYYLKAETLLQSGDSILALQEFKNALQQENASLDIVASYLQTLEELDRMADFGEVYRDLPAKQQNDDDIKWLLANALINMDQQDSAKVILNSIHKPNLSDEKFLLLADLNFNQRNYDSAIFYAEKSFAINSSTDPLIIKARALDRRYRYNDAVLAYEQILQIDSTFTIAGEELEKLRRKIRYLRDLKRKEEMKIETLPSRSLTPKNLEQ